MNRPISLAAVLLMTAIAIAQQPSVQTPSSGFDHGRSIADTRLGYHDVLATPAGDNLRNAAQRDACQTCHVPHRSDRASVYANTADRELSTENVSMYVWKSDTVITGRREKTVAVPTMSLHTLTCLSCHDGAIATDVIANKTRRSRLRRPDDSIMNVHPVHRAMVGPSAAVRRYTRLYDAQGEVKGMLGKGGYVECGSCHDPHVGDPRTYDFLRGPGNQLIADPSGDFLTSYARRYDQLDRAGGTTSYLGTNPQWARLGLCRDCHDN